MTQKTTIVAGCVALTLAGIGAVALTRREHAEPSVAVGTSETPSTSKESPVEKLAASAELRWKSRNRDRVAVRYPELSEKYGQSRTTLSARVTESVVSLIQDAVDMGQMESSGPLANALGGADGALRRELGTLDSDLKLTNEQRDKANALLIDFKKRQLEKRQGAIEQLKRDPTPLMGLMLASDAFVRGKMNETEFNELRGSSLGDLEGVVTPLNKDVSRTEKVLEDKEFLGALERILDADQSETFQEYRTEQGAKAPTPSSNGITPFPPMELEKLEESVNSLKKLTSGFKSMIEEVGNLEKLNPEQGGHPSSPQD